MSAEDEAQHDAIRPCPNCGKPASRDYRPFCSKRCADVDLARWLKEGYTIPDDEPDAAAQTPDRKE